MTDTLHIPEFAHGYLLATSHKIFDQVLETGDISEIETTEWVKIIDDWQQVDDVPLYAGEHCAYADYDLNFWYDEDEDKWHCTVYEIWHDEEGYAHTKVDEYRRLW